VSLCARGKPEDGIVPDNQDYEWLAERLRDPGAWTEQDYDTMCFLAANQRDSLRSMHPLDKRRRASAARAAEQMEAAIAAHAALRQ